MQTIEQFIRELENESLVRFGFSENLYAGNNIESVIRKHNLLTYLEKMKSLNLKSYYLVKHQVIKVVD